MKATRFLLPAEVEMCDAATYYQTQAHGLGDAFLTKVESAVRDIAEHPQAWPIVQGSIHKRLVHRFPYSILYRIDPDEIVIIAVMHQRRRPGYWLGRIARQKHSSVGELVFTTNHALRCIVGKITEGKLNQTRAAIMRLLQLR